LPGTINYPTAKKRELGRTKCQAKLLEDTERIYALSDFPRYEAAEDKPQQERRELPRTLEALLYHKGTDPYPTRSELLFAFLTEAVRRRVDDATLVNACLDRKYKNSAIFEHCEENGGKQYVERQIKRAREKVKSTPSQEGGRKEVVLVNAAD